MKKTHIVAILIAFFFAVQAKAQTCQILKGVYGNAVSSGSIATDALGSTFIGGSYSDTIMFDQSTQAVASTWRGDAFVAKYSGTGNLIWNKVTTAPAASNSGAGVTAMTTVGAELYVTGLFWGTISIESQTFTSTGPTDGFFVKLNALNGSLVSFTQFGGAGWQMPHAIAVRGNRVCIAGEFDTSISFGSSPINSAGGLDAFVYVFDTAGNPIRVATGGGTSDDEAYGVAFDSSDNYYITGTFCESDALGTATFGTTTLTSAGYGDMFFAKYSSSGSFVFAKQAGGSDSDVGKGICLNSLGNVEVVGSFQDAIDFGTSVLVGGSGGNGFAAMYDQNGTLIWDKVIVSDQGQCLGVAPGISGDVLVAGTFQNSCVFGSTSLTSSGQFDFFVARIDQNGICTGGFSGGSPNEEEHPFAIATDANGSVYLTGNFSSQGLLAFGSQSLNSSLSTGSSYGFFAKFSGLNGVTESNHNTVSLSAYPNPFSDKSNLVLPENELCTVSVVDLTGNEVLRFEQATDAVSISHEALSAGVYFCLVATADGKKFAPVKIIAQ